jgi:TolA-binding protein
MVTQVGSPVLTGIVATLLALQFFFPRVAKALGPILGAVGRYWHGREERAERELQALLAARRATDQQTSGYQLEDMERQIRYFAEVVDKLRGENQELRDHLREAHRLLLETRDEVGETRQEVGRIRHTLDTGERLAVLPPPPPPVAGRHRHAPTAETTRIDMQETQ